MDILLILISFFVVYYVTYGFEGFKLFSFQEVLVIVIGMPIVA